VNVNIRSILRPQLPWNPSVALWEELEDELERNLFRHLPPGIDRPSFLMEPDGQEIVRRWRRRNHLFD
jgi:hypothetical protein